MPHQCVRCGEFFDDGAQEILSGCHCGGKLFFFIKKSKLEAAKQAKIVDLSEDDKKQMEADIFDMVGADPEADSPVILDFESVRVAQPGKYEIDLVHLFKKEPVVFRVADGKYIIDLQQTFDSVRDSKPKG